MVQVPENEPTRAAIDASILAVRAHLTTICADVREHAVTLGHDGMTIGAGRAQLQTQGAPKVHPVWADDLRADIRAERRQHIETGPPLPIEVDLDTWPPASLAEYEAWVQQWNAIEREPTESSEVWLTEFRDSPPRP